ncbi:hypothetical protein B0O99DRAFT_511123 [Bisporella sp. PMI_857]|nr:hypothetical protein B0O99DRAFT_511123 [Bisporella sp. PMI_857]
MFGLGAGRSAYPNVYATGASKKSTKGNGYAPNLSGNQTSSTESFEPAIDGPPSPEHIRAYTEQMKRSSIFGNNSSRTTLSSGASSFRSRESVAASTDSLSLSRKSSVRSTAGNMPSPRSDRPESVQIFGKTLFTRRGRRVKAESIDENIREEETKDSINGYNSSSRRGTMTSSGSPSLSGESRTRHQISGPFNFQHVTHTGHNCLPNLEKVSQGELVSEFSAIRASQIPTNGELKGIRAQDLHFENFSSEALDSPPIDQSAPPPRPPRSPLSPTSPVVPPIRTSSRAASVLFDTFDPLANTSIERPQTHGGFRKPAPFGLPGSPPPPPSWNEQEECFSDRPMSHALTTPGNEAWPLTASPSGTFGVELADVQEEDEEVAKRRSRMSTGSGELRISQSVPALRLRSLAQTGDSSSAQKPPLSPGFRMSGASWDNAIDYAYEHEAEADCDYQWDRCSVEDDRATIAEVSPTTVKQPALGLPIEDDQRSVYNSRFRPSLLVPSPIDVPELSPMSLTSTASSNPRSPSNFLRPGHVRSSSHASSFKESHGFNLSPSLLIPSDFKSQMEQDDIYEHYSQQNENEPTAVFVQDSYTHCISPLDETSSSTASYRSSNFSRGSARSSSSTRISGSHSRGSQDSIMMLSSVAILNAAHRSIGSASSLPDLIPSTKAKADLAAESELSVNLDELNIQEENTEATTMAAGLASRKGSVSSMHRRNKSSGKEQGLRSGVHHLALPPKPLAEIEKGLSPVAESFVEAATSHGRKVSAPVVTQTVKEFKGRARSATSSGPAAGKKARSSYMLFPQV